MRNSEGDSPIVYTLLDVAEPSTHSTPARREMAGTTGQSREDRTFLQDIGFDAPITAGRNSTQRRAVPFDNSVRQPPSVFDDPHIHFDRRRTHMKPGRFDAPAHLNRSSLSSRFAPNITIGQKVTGSTSCDVRWTRRQLNSFGTSVPKRTSPTKSWWDGCDNVTEPRAKPRHFGRNSTTAVKDQTRTLATSYMIFGAW